MRTTLEHEVERVARRIAELSGGERSRVYRMSFWSERMLDWAMARPEFKTQLFRFVDAFPAMADTVDVDRHLREYFADDAPAALGRGLDVASHLPLGRNVSAHVARRNIARMAEQFIVGSSPGDAVAGLERLWRQGSAATVDLLGEKTVVRSDADRYASRVGDMLAALCDAAAAWPPDDHLDRDDLGVVPRVNISVKPTALASHYEPLTADEGLDQAAQRLRPILRMACERGATVHFDMEHYDVKDLTLALFRRLLDEPELATLDAGVVVQAYLKESRDDLADLIAWSARRQRDVEGAKPIMVRLVKGAYWDTETVLAHAHGWPVPVFEHKDETDANYERLIRLSHDHHGEVRAAFGSHNVRSLAYAIVYAADRGVPDNGYEIQMLHGMAEPLHAAIRRLGRRLRVYAPVGELVPGMAYLVRRLLENTSNDSFVRHRFAEGEALDELIEPPRVDTLPKPDVSMTRSSTDANDPTAYLPEPVREWRREAARTAFATAVRRVGEPIDAAVDTGRPVDVPAVIGGERVCTATTIDSLDPARPDVIVARSAASTRQEADDAIAVATSAFESWSRTPVQDRAAVLFKTAAWFRERRDEIAALECFEAGKPWAQADADVCEAIDFCEYYGREMLCLGAGGTVQSPPGESNRLTYRPKGVAAVIAPWNFPLAIPTGMTAAALVAGNPTILKPAEQTPAVAAKLVEGLLASGLPPGAIGFLPGVGEDVGRRLIEHPDVAVIAFTGSLAVGLQINEAAARTGSAQRHIKRVVCELGGKNALIVDSDADPDQVVPAAVDSAFGYSGQKCSALSRLIVHEHAWDAVMPRLVEAVGELRIGHPRDMSTQVGPLIDADAHARVRGFVKRAHDDGNVLLSGDDIPDHGFFVGPCVVTDLGRDVPVWRDEVFGPLLAVRRVASLDEAIDVANDTTYGLTAGIFSRSPVNIRRAAAELRAGNVYVNRGITGSVVGRQPFGGIGLSGVGSKAGGPDYLLQFCDPVAVSENTLRQGFAPEQ